MFDLRGTHRKYRRVNRFNTQTIGFSVFSIGGSMLNIQMKHLFGLISLTMCGWTVFQLKKQGESKFTFLD